MNKKELKKTYCDIIIPTYENEHFTSACIESIKRCTPAGKFRIIWVDNNSKNAGQVYTALQGVNHVAVRLTKNYGFVGAVNYGLSISNADYICLLNNDTIVSPRWLDKLTVSLEENPKLGIVGPLTAPNPVPREYDSHHNIRHIEDNAHHRIFPEFKNLDDFNIQIEKAFAKRLMEISFVAFLCAVIRREVLKRVGLLDANYAMGMYDDNDYNLAARRAGFETKLLWDTCILHFGRSTFKVIQHKERFDVDALLRRNRTYLMRKWGLKKA